MTAPDNSSDPVSVLVVVPTLNVGGTERHLCQMLPRLDRPDHRVVVCTLVEKGTLAPGLERRGIRVHGPSSPQPPWSRIAPAARVFWLLRTAARLWRLIRRCQPSIIHFYLPSAYLVGALVAWIGGKRNLVMSRRCLNLYQERHPLLARLERRLHKRMSAILGNSMAVIGQLADEGVAQNRLGLIYSGVDLASSEPANSRIEGRRRLEIDAASLVMATVANLIPYKGHFDLLTALGAIRERLPPGWLLLCVGRDQEAMLEALRGDAKRLGIAANVRFLGERMDVPDILAAADLGLLCSHEEGMPNVVLEYMAASLPVVSTDVGGAAEAVVPRETGLLVPARDPAALGAAILEIAADRERARRMGAAGRRVVTRRFSLERCAAQYRSLYDTLLGGATLSVAEAIGAKDPGAPARRHTVSVVIPT